MSRDGTVKFEIGIMRVFRTAAPLHPAGRRLRLASVYPFVETIIHSGLKDTQPFEDNQFCWSPDDQQSLDKLLIVAPSYAPFSTSTEIPSAQHV